MFLEGKGYRRWANLNLGESFGTFIPLYMSRGQSSEFRLQGTVLGLFTVHDSDSDDMPVDADDRRSFLISVPGLD